MPKGTRKKIFRKKMATKKTAKSAHVMKMKTETEMKYDEKKLPVSDSIDKPDIAAWRKFKPKIDLKICTKDYSCVVLCPHNAFDVKKDGFPEIDYSRCTGCLICLRVCPVSAIFEEKEL